MKLYIAHQSPNSRKMLALMNFLDVEIDTHFPDLTKGEHKSPEYLAINPNGKVPALVDGDLKLWESNSIMRYVVDKLAPGHSLYPKDLAVRADINRWLDWELAHFNQAAGVLGWERVAKRFFNIGEPNQALTDEAEEKLAVYCQVLDQQLEGKDFVTGSTVTLADIALAALQILYTPANIPVSNYANITRWLSNMDKQPEWADSLPEALPA